MERARSRPTIRAVHPNLLLPARTATGPESLAEYRARGGYQGLAQAQQKGAAWLCAEVAAAQLRGRGGASFPTARKWQLAAAAVADEKFVVGNGGEHEPGSEKDKVLVARHPHAVLEGLVLAGLATGAQKSAVTSASAVFGEGLSGCASGAHEQHRRVHRARMVGSAPKLCDGDGEHAIPEADGHLSVVEDHPATKPLPRGLAKPAKAPEIGWVHSRRCLHLNAARAGSRVFDHDVYLGPVFVAVVRECDSVVETRRLPSQFAVDEGLKHLAEQLAVVP